MTNRPDLIARQVVIGVMFDTVTIELHCGDEYAAQVLHDDLCQRIASGEGISLRATPVVEKVGAGR